jgi:hypothetical protein
MGRRDQNVTDRSKNDSPVSLFISVPSKSLVARFPDPPVDVAEARIVAQCIRYPARTVNIRFPQRSADDPAARADNGVTLLA